MSIAHLIATPKSLHIVHIVTVYIVVGDFICSRCLLFSPGSCSRCDFIVFYSSAILLLLLPMAARYLNNMSFVTLDSRTVN